MPFGTNNLLSQVKINQDKGSLQPQTHSWHITVLRAKELCCLHRAGDASSPWLLSNRAARGPAQSAARSRGELGRLGRREKCVLIQQELSGNSSWLISFYYRLQRCSQEDGLSNLISLCIPGMFAARPAVAACTVPAQPSRQPSPRS